MSIVCMCITAHSYTYIHAFIDAAGVVVVAGVVQFKRSAFGWCSSIWYPKLLRQVWLTWIVIVRSRLLILNRKSTRMSFACVVIFFFVYSTQYSKLGVKWSNGTTRGLYVCWLKLTHFDMLMASKETKNQVKQKIQQQTVQRKATIHTWLMEWTYPHL